MNAEELERLVRNPTVASQLLDQLTRLPDGTQTVIVGPSPGCQQELRVVRLRRCGNKLRPSQLAEPNNN